MATSGSSRLPSSRPTLAVPGAEVSAPIRRHSLFGTEDRIILDIGSRWSKVGFSGEAAPRKIFKTVEAARRPGVDFPPELTIHNAESRRDGVAKDDETLQWHELLWDLNIARGTTSSALEERRLLLKGRLTVLLRRVYSEYLLTDPSTRKVILVENPHMPTVIRETIYEVLFHSLKVQSVSPMSSALLSIFATGSMTGLVVDVGALETRVLPVFSGRPLLSNFTSTTKGGRGLESRLKALLVRYGRHVTPANSGVGHGDMSSRTRKIDPALLTQDVLQNIIVSSCFVGQTAAVDASDYNVRDPSPSRTRQQRAPQQDLKPDWQLPHTGDHAAISRAASALRVYDEADDVDLLRRLRSRYMRSSSANHILIPLRPGQRRLSTFPTSAVTLNSPTSTSSRSSAISDMRGNLVVPGWLREHLLDFFWEHPSEGDGTDREDKSLSVLILSTLVGLPVDLRREMIGSILVTGGYASFPGFPHRVRCELMETLHAIQMPVQDGHESTRDKSSKVKISTSLSKTRVGTRYPRGNDHNLYHTSCLPWTDQVTFSTLKQLEPHIAVLNGHLPSGADDQAESAKQQMGRRGTAPLIPPLIYPWFGGSLAGSLKLTSIESITREEWLAEQRRLRKKGQPRKSRGVTNIDLEADATKGTATSIPPSRPGFGAAGGGETISTAPDIENGAKRPRGSFMGVVSGLETGAYGGLTTVSRHLSGGRDTGGLRSPPLSSSSGGGGGAG